MDGLCSEPSPFAPGAVIAGKYRVEREIGAGGVGVVALATHIELGQRVAIKYLRGGGMAKPQSIERFKREAKLAASLRSEHVVKVFDVGTLEGVPYMVMEYLEGEDLSQVLERGAIPIEQAIQWTLEACHALEEAHSLGIVHRDLKPANLFLARRSNGAPIVKILDFGISKILETSAFSSLPTMTRQNEIFGTPHYMSPEQLVSSTNVDARSDVWAMGVVLYELLTRRLPFEGDDLRQLVADVLSSVPQPVRDHRGDIPIELAQVVHACLSYDPEQRPRTIGHLAARIRPFASAQYVRSLALAETSPEVSGLHDLGWVHPAGPSAPAVLQGVDRPRSSFTLFAAIGAASLLAGASVAVAALLMTRAPAPSAQSLVGAEPPREVLVAMPSAPEPPPHVEIIEIAKEDASVPATRKEARPAASARPVRAAATTDEFGDRR